MQTATSSYAAHNYLQLQQNFPFNADIQTERHNAVSGLENENSSPQDTLSLSPESKKIAEEQQAEAVSDEKSSSLQPLTEEEVQKVEELKKRDAEVRAHEQAHLSAAGSYAAGGASFSYTTGPNGKLYATGGEVPIDISKADTPQATISKMQTIRRAALAPAHPSSADRAIAAQATAKELQAKQEIQAQEPSLEQTNVPNVEQSNDENIAKPANDTQEFTQRSMMIAAYTAMASLAS